MLILYPHGLGDILLLTPALRALDGEPPHVAVLRRFRGTQILDGCPWVEQVHYVLPDPWHDTTKQGCRQWGRNYAKKQGETPVWIWHPKEMHKILYNAHILDVVLVNHRAEVWIDDEAKEIADAWLREHVRPPYGFLHCATGMPGWTRVAHKKDFPSQWGRRWLKARGMRDVVEVGESFAKTDFPMPVQFEILRRADVLCLADSVFYHAAHALGKKVDLAYFGRRESVHRRVKPLHEGFREWVVWSLPTL